MVVMSASKAAASKVSCAVDTTSGKVIPSTGSGMHPYAARMPPPKRTGNALIDSDNQSKVDMLKEVVSSCLADLSHVPVIYSKLRERQRLSFSSLSDQDFMDVKQLKQLPTDFLVEFVAARSDLTVDEVVRAMSYDPDVPAQLVAFETQLPLSLSWPDILRCRELTYRFLDHRSHECDSRLKGFKAAGGLNDQGAINFAMCSYHLTFTDGRLSEIKHCSGDVHQVDPEIHIYQKNAELLENWSDMNATIVMPAPNPPWLIAKFFLHSNNGPYNKFKIITKKCSELDKMVKQVAAIWDEDRSKASSAKAAAGTLAKCKILELKQSQQRERNAKTRAKALETVKARKQKKVIQLQAK